MTDHSHSDRSTAQASDRDHTSITRGVKRRVTSPSWLAHTAGVSMSGLAVAFVLVFVVVLDDGGELALVTRPLPMQVALLFPYLIAVLAFGTTAGTLLAWWRRYWSLPTRIHQTILAVLGIGFTWQLHELGFVVI